MLFSYNREIQAKAATQEREVKTIVTPPQLTFEQFLDYDDGTDALYELIHGIPVAMPEPSDLHEDIVDFLKGVFQRESDRLKCNWKVRTNRLIQIPVGGNADGRRPDIAIVDNGMPDPDRRAIYDPPRLIVEIMSKNWKDDLEPKLRDYALLQVPEYWAIDYRGQIPEKHCTRGKGIKTIVFTLKGYQFERKEYLADEIIHGDTFSDLTLTTAQILNLGT